MSKKHLLLIAIIIMLVISTISFLYVFKPVPLSLLSADQIYIEELTGAGFGADGELKNCYWVITFTADVKQSHFFILNKELSYANNIRDTFQGKEVRPYSVINVTIIPQQPYYTIALDRHVVKLAPEVFSVWRGNPYMYDGEKWVSTKQDAVVDVAWDLPASWGYLLHTPFQVIVEKNGIVVNSFIIDAIGIEKQFFIVGDESKDEKARIDVLGKLMEGYSPPSYSESFTYFGKGKALQTRTSKGETIYELIEYKSKIVQFNPEFPDPTEVPDYDAMGDLHYFKYWFGGDSLSYVWHNNPYVTGNVHGFIDALGKPRPPIYYYSFDGSGVYYVPKSGFCDLHPAWTAYDVYTDWLGRKYYQSATYSPPSLTEDNPSTTPSGKSAYNWLLQDAGASYVNVKGPWGKDEEFKEDTLYIYYDMGTTAIDVISLRISTELADTYVYGEYITKFDILESQSYWESTGTLTGVKIPQKVPEVLQIAVKNVGNVSANAQIKITAVYPTNFFDFVSMPTSILSNATIEPGNVYYFKIRVELKGSSVKFDFKLRISVWCEAYEQDITYAEGTVLESESTLKIYTVGDNNKAKIYINGVETPRNKVTYYEAVLPKGTYKIEFETLENFNVPTITVNNVQVGYGWTIVALNPGDTKVVIATYISSEVNLITGFVSWSDKGLLGISPTYNPLVGTRVNVPEWNVVRLRVNITAVGNIVKGNLSIVILADEEEPVYYAEKSYSIDLGSGATRVLDIDFMLGSSKGYYYQIWFNNAVIYADYNTDTRPEVFTIPWYLAYGLYIGIGVSVIIALIIVLYYVKWKALARGSIRY